MHITRCLTPRPHNSGEAPCSFTMAPCVVVERLEGKQQNSRAPVGEHAEVQAQDAECGCHEQQEVNEKRPKPRNSPSHNHDSTAPRQHPLIYTGVGSIHPVHGPLWSPTTEAIAPKGFTFSPFWRVPCKYFIFTGHKVCVLHVSHRVMEMSPSYRWYDTMKTPSGGPMSDDA